MKTDTNITVRVNPSGAPPVGGAGGSCTCPPLDFTPLESLSVGTRFPFGVVNWVHDMFGTSSGAAYSFSLSTPGSGVGAALGTISTDSSWWDSTGRAYSWPIMEFGISLMFWAFFAFKILGLGGGGDD
jgi:hypothetical protein